jgi:sodium/bile acid cotransporter 7
MTLASRILKFDGGDEAALVFCGSQKSLVSGVPIANALVYGPQIGPILLPLMLYYPMQVLICAWMARRYAASAGSRAMAANRHPWAITLRSSQVPNNDDDAPRPELPMAASDVC